VNDYLPCSGLGDSVYAQPIIAEAIKNKSNVAVYSNFPDIFSGLNCTVLPYKATGARYDIRYLADKSNQSTTQYYDMCKRANIFTPFKLRKKNNTPIIDGEYLLFRPPSLPMRSARSVKLLPAVGAYYRLIQSFGMKLVASGNTEDIINYHYPYDIDMVGKTTVEEYLNLCEHATKIVTYPCNLVPLGEGYGVDTTVMFSRQGLDCDDSFLNTITPQKIIEYKEKTSWVIDDEYGV